MLLTLYAKFLVPFCWIFVSTVYSQSTDCGYVPENLQNTNEEGTWPWMVAITKKEGTGNYRFWCNGFLIDRRHVLTTAHCIETVDVSDLLVRIGKKNRNEGEVYEVACVTQHPLYKRGRYYDDIAIVTLSGNVDTPNYTPICLPDDNLEFKSLNGVEVTKTAWGTTTFGGTVGETLLHNAGLRIISNRDCSKEFRKFISSFSRQFPGGVSCGIVCTVNPTEQTESCGGSSGAPLMYRDDSNKWIAVGINVFGSSCGTDAPSGFTRVSAHLDWIIENTKDNKRNCS